MKAKSIVLPSSASLNPILLASAIALLLLLLVAPLRAGEWMTSYSEAQAKAKEASKPLVMLFTGSDWCPPCKMMEKDVFSSEEFGAYAEQNLVLLKLDFPRKTPQSDELKKQNGELAEKFGIQGFPTVVVLSPEGKVLGSEVGFRPLDQFMKWIESPSSGS